MASVFTVLAQSAIPEGGDLFLAILSYLRRLYPDVCSPAVSLGWAPAHREIPLKEDGVVLSGGNLSDNSYITLGA